MIQFSKNDYTNRSFGEGVSSVSVDTQSFLTPNIAVGVPETGFSGGEFWDGARNGLISASLNHVAHGIRQRIEQKRKVIDSTKEAIKHYFEGNGEEVELGLKTQKALKKDPDYLRVLKRLQTGMANSRSNTFDVDLTNRIFHVGESNVDYSTSCTTGECTTVFEAFVRDGFRDPLNLGIEVYKGTPYNYVPYVFKVNYPNPGYEIGINIK